MPPDTIRCELNHRKLIWTNYKEIYCRDYSMGAHRRKGNYVNPRDPRWVTTSQTEVVHPGTPQAYDLTTNRIVLPRKARAVLVTEDQLVVINVSLNLFLSGLYSCSNRHQTDGPDMYSDIYIFG
jgi:hypothetical protein